MRSVSSRLARDGPVFKKSIAGASVLACAIRSYEVTLAEDRNLLRNVSAPDAALTRP
jgi:hypothetical protein